MSRTCPEFLEPRRQIELLLVATESDLRRAYPPPVSDHIGRTQSPLECAGTPEGAAVSNRQCRETSESCMRDMMAVHQGKKAVEKYI
jgi:hypothetical protein